jgi:cardiolipin synthase
VVSRDAVQVAGAAFLRSTGRDVQITPTRIGKYATFAIATTVVLALASDFGAYPRAAAAPYVASMGLLAAECLALSFGQYFLLFVRSLRGSS